MRRSTAAGVIGRATARARVLEAAARRELPRRARSRRLADPACGGGGIARERMRHRGYRNFAPREALESGREVTADRPRPRGSLSTPTRLTAGRAPLSAALLRLRIGRAAGRAVPSRLRRRVPRDPRPLPRAAARIRAPDAARARRRPRGCAPGRLRARLPRAARAANRPVMLRAWLYRIAHNRCIDELRRPIAVPSELDGETPSRRSAPRASAETRRSWRSAATTLARLRRRRADAAGASSARRCSCARCRGSATRSSRTRWASRYPP